MLRHALSASDLERRRIARDLHDGLVQDLAGLGYALPSVLDQLPPEAEDARRVLGSVSVQLHRDVTALRGLLIDVYPSSLSGGGLQPAVEELAKRARESGLLVTVVVDSALTDTSPEVAKLVYRVVREALRNVVRHAHATQASVVADVVGHQAVVTVSDDGVGMDGIPTPSGHVGLRLLTDTLDDVGGRIRLSSPPGGGTTVRATFPLSLADGLD